MCVYIYKYIKVKVVLKQVQAIHLCRCGHVTLTLQALVLFLHADKENLLVDGLFPQSSIISSGALSVLSSQILGGGQQPG